VAFLALQRQGFVDHPRTLLPIAQMAPGARCALVAASQGKPRILFMIEFFGQPVTCHMAGIAGDELTARRLVFAELSPVGILVARSAVGLQPPVVCPAVLAVTGLTGQIPVPAIQGKPCQGVVQRHHRPRFLIMATGAIGTG
jgi:hypothetical protein